MNSELLLVLDTVFKNFYIMYNILLQLLCLYFIRIMYFFYLKYLKENDENMCI
jgi:Na+/phosphate symporter